MKLLFEFLLNHHNSTLIGMSANGKHTILLLQAQGAMSRTYYDFPSSSQCIEFLVKSFENELMRMNPRIRTLQYHVSDIHHYIDSLNECNILIYNKDISAYIPYGKDSIKQRIMELINRA